MPANRSHEFFARHSPIKLWWMVITVLVAFVMFRLGEFSLASLARWPNTLVLLGIIPGAPVAAVFITGITYGLFARLIWNPEKFVVRRNGGPFKLGDNVRVLSGPHRGQTGHIYKLSGGQDGTPEKFIHVALGDAAKIDYSDFFEHCQVMRA
jgi:hypothetical protein